LSHGETSSDFVTLLWADVRPLPFFPPLFGSSWQMGRTTDLSGGERLASSLGG